MRYEDVKVHCPLCNIEGAPEANAELETKHVELEKKFGDHVKSLNDAEAEAKSLREQLDVTIEDNKKLDGENLVLKDAGKAKDTQINKLSKELKKIKK